jgi:NADPH-dependent 2,4-dienoyl-CoA reductase/sulfur reductase-like enzyme/rhodanese-related sulfurtransferase
MSDHPRRVLIVGGVAGGASCAARLRRLDENAEIILFDRHPYVSPAVCGLPYYIGKVIAGEDQLMLATPQILADRFRILVRTSSEVLSIDRSRGEVQVRDLQTGGSYREPYDALVLSPGASAVRPRLPGAELPGVFTLHTIEDGRLIRDWIEERRPEKAVIVGGGLIGLEMADNLARRGLKVSLVERMPQVMAALDPEMAEPVHRYLESHRVDLRLNEQVAGFEAGLGGTLAVRTREGRRPLEAGLVILAVGLEPEISIAEAAGLAVGDAGGIRVDEQMRTSDPAIWAVGDAVEVRDVVTGAPRLFPMAGLAHRQGRVAADSICGRNSAFRGAQATVVCGFFGLTAAATGASEKQLRAAGIGDYECVYLHPGHHASYYPGARPIHMKVVFRRPDGLILGAQAVGEEGVERRIDVLSMAIQRQATVFHLEESEMCYAPQYGSAKDPLNIAGMIAANVLRGDARLAPWPELSGTDALLLDVRDPDEFAAGHIEGATSIPLHELRRRFPELPTGREIWVYCGVGQRAYYASRILDQSGLRVRFLSGGYQTYWGWNE